MEARDIAAALAAATEGVGEVTASLTADDDALTGTIDDLAVCIAVIAGLRLGVQALELELGDAVAHRMEADRVAVEGGWLTREQKYASKWRNEDARNAAMKAMIYELGHDPATGEVAPHVARTIERTFRMVEQSFSIGQPKAAFRNVLGLDTADYVETTEAGFKVGFLSAAEAVPGRRA